MSDFLGCQGLQQRHQPDCYHHSGRNQTDARSQFRPFLRCLTPDKSPLGYSGPLIGKPRFPGSVGALVKAFTPPRTEGRIAG
jgi:hypothetical protein